MRFRDIIAFGTERYPEKVARRLRAINIIAWMGAALVGQFAIRNLIDPAPGLFERGLTAVAVSTCFALIPLLHRFNSAAALVALTALAYLDIFRVAWTSGTGGGHWLGYFAAISLVVLLLGPERYILSGLLALAAAGLVVALHLLAPYNTGLFPPDVLLYGTFLNNVVFYLILIFVVVFYAAWQIERSETATERERERSDALLANILPSSVAEQLKRAPDQVVAERYDEASVLFADMEGFTSRASTMSPDDLVRFLDRVFSTFDRLAEKHGVEKIKTSGDSYMVVSGVPERRADHAERLAAFALDMRDTAARFGEIGEPLPIRIGMASGPVVAGVVGSKRFFFDVWGDAVNMASRMETTGRPGSIQVSAQACERLAGKFQFEPRGSIDIKGKGLVETWFLVGRGAASAGARLFQDVIPGRREASSPDPEPMNTDVRA